MKRAVVGSMAVLMVAAGILVMSMATIFTPSPVFPAAEEATVSAVVMVAPRSEYYLPYPGLLPDSPFYKLKAARDRVGLWMTRDEGKKITRELLYADKRINAAWFLAQGGKVGLGVTTATKAEKYLESAVNRVEKLSRGGQDVKSLLLTLQKAVPKHGEILEALAGKTTGPERNAVENSAKLNKLLEERVAQVLMEAK